MSAHEQTGGAAVVVGFFLAASAAVLAGAPGAGAEPPHDGPMVRESAPHEAPVAQSEPVFEALAAADVARVFELHTAGQDLDVPNTDGITPLIAACFSGERGIVSALLELHVDATRAHTVSSERLASLGFPVDPRAVAEIEVSPLIAATHGADTVTVASLLAHRVSIDRPTAEGLTPLLLASLEGRAKMVEFLLDLGAHPNGEGKVHAELLADSALEVEPGDSAPTAPLHAAADRGHATIVELLVRRGADVELPGYRGRTALLLAAKRGSTTVVRRLIEAGANVDGADDAGNRPLSEAIAESHRGVVALLIESGADLDAFNADGETPLSVSVYRNDVATAARLIEAGAGVGLRQYDGDTALHRAAVDGRTRMVELLLEAGADVGVRNNWDETPLDLALDRGHDAAVELLRRASERPPGTERNGSRATDAADGDGEAEPG